MILQVVSRCWFIHTALLSIPFLIVAAKACSRAQLQFWIFGNESRKKPFLMILQVISRGFGLAEFIQGTHQVLYCEIYLFDWFSKIESPQDEHREFSWNPLKCFVRHLFPLSLKSTFYNDVRTSGSGKDTLHLAQDTSRLQVAFWTCWKRERGLIIMIEISPQTILHPFLRSAAWCPSAEIFLSQKELSINSKRLRAALIQFNGGIVLVKGDFVYP